MINQIFSQLSDKESDYSNITRKLTTWYLMSKRKKYITTQNELQKAATPPSF